MLRCAALFLALALLGAGCAGGPDAQRAQELLARAQAAESRVTSATYELELAVSAEGKDVTIALTGGGYLKGKRAGDQYLRGSVTGALGNVELEFVSLGRRAYARLGGNWQAIPRPVIPSAAGQQGFGSAAFLELSRYVLDVRVTEDQFLAGEPSATIAGTIDTAGLVKAAARLDGFSQLVGEAAPQLSEVAEHLGDTSAVLVISERTHLVRAAVIDLTIEQDGKELELRLIYRLRGVNKPVQMPKPT
jgi:hypothetical protein